jgi:hypothetical protein
MAIKALTLSAVATVELDFDDAKGTPDATKFTIGALDAFVTAYVYDRTLTFSEVDGKDTAQVKMNEANIEAVRFGLKGWSNFKDAAGSDVEFATVDKIVLGKKYVVVSDGALAALPPEVIREVALKIRKINEVTADEAGKSAAA